MQAAKFWVFLSSGAGKLPHSSASEALKQNGCTGEMVGKQERNRNLDARVWKKKKKKIGKGILRGHKGKNNVRAGNLGNGPFIFFSIPFLPQV
jgi:hypothetical protein